MRENGFSRIPLFQSSEPCRKVDMRPSMILIFSLLGTVLSLYCFIVNICIFYWPIEITCLCQFLLTAIGKNLSDWPSSLKKEIKLDLEHMIELMGMLLRPKLWINTFTAFKNGLKLWKSESYIFLQVMYEATIKNHDVKNFSATGQQVKVQMEIWNCENQLNWLKIIRC